ncbi:MAG: response regulator [Alphaproteobacteria bacterium]
MSLARQIEPHIPLLRRYARALSGSRDTGDGNVFACLEALTESPEDFGASLPTRVALFQFFHRTIDTDDDQEQPANLAESRAMKAADERLGQLDPRARQAMLLTAMEGFSAQETATILDIDEWEVADLLDQAEADLAQAMKARVLLIEDEPVIALDIARHVQELGHHVTRVATTKEEAINAAQEDKPDLLLADIQLADGSSGIDAASEILREIEAPVIFITAFPERLLTGRKVEPTYLITKPFVPSAIKVAISQALFFRENARRLS